MPYNYKFRVIADSYNCPLTYHFVTEDAAMARYKRLTNNGWKCEIWPIKHNTDQNRADYEYRLFDIVDLKNQFGIVLCLPNDDAEFHGFKDKLEDCFDYIDNYWYEQDKN